MKRKICMFISFLLLFCGCSQNQQPSQLEVGDFSYVYDCSYHEGSPGVKKSDFVNTENTQLKNAEHAVELAKKECTIKYDTINIDFDAESEIYRITFYDKDYPGGGQSVYINHKGITLLIIYGE